MRTALFPIGSSKRPIGVVSDRAIKHLHELNLLQQAGQDSEGRAVHCAVLFIVNRCGGELYTNSIQKSCGHFSHQIQQLM